MPAIIIYNVKENIWSLFIFILGEKREGSSNKIKLSHASNMNLKWFEKGAKKLKQAYDQQIKQQVQILSTSILLPFYKHFMSNTLFLTSHYFSLDHSATQYDRILFANSLRFPRSSRSVLSDSLRTNRANSAINTKKY